MENNLGAILLMLDAIRLELRAASCTEFPNKRKIHSQADERAARAEATWEPAPRPSGDCMAR